MSDLLNWAELPLEQKLLLAAASVDAAKWPLPAAWAKGPLDWERLLREARRHWVVPQLCQFLKQAAPGVVPAQVLDELNQQTQNNTLRNLRMTGELWEILSLYSAHGISAVPFKGPTLAALAGDDLSWRSFGDLDLLLERQAIPQASTLLKTRGYQVEPNWAATQDARFLDVTYTLEFRQPERGLRVELHWELFPHYMSFGFAPDDLRRRLAPVEPGGKPMQTLAPDDLLLYLCAHAAKHRWPMLNGVVDVARLIDSCPPWQWEALLAEAETRNLRRVTLLGLLLAKELLGAPVPDWLSARAQQDSGLMRLAVATVAEMLFPKQQKLGGWMGYQFRYFFVLQQDWPARLLYLFRLITAPNVGDWQFQPLPSQWAFLYTALRPFRLLSRYLKFNAR